MLSNRTLCGVKMLLNFTMISNSAAELFSFGEISGGVILGGSQGSQGSCSTPIRKDGNINYTSFEAPGLQC